MKIRVIRWLIVIFILLPPLFVWLLPSGPGGPPYRLKERIEAIKAYSLNPSESTKTALDEEEARLDHHLKMVGVVLVLPFLLVDGVVVYFFWNYGAPKTGLAH